jgi:hypothetical protein
MKIFNGRLATEDYMSSHSLTFSTPEMTLKKFALWLGDQVNDPKTNIHAPRLLLYIEDRNESLPTSKNSKEKFDFIPDTDESFKPTGDITTLFEENTLDKSFKTTDSNIGKRYCINCGTIIKQSSKFCKICGAVQE